MNDSSDFNYFGLVIVLLFGVVVSAGSVWLLKQLRVHNTILRSTLAMGMAVFLLGFLKGGSMSGAEAMELAAFGLALGVVVGAFLWIIEWLGKRRERSQTQ